MATATPVPPATIAPAHEAMIKALPWVEDGISSFEKHLVSILYGLAENAPRSFEALMAKPWMSERDDDPNQVEPLVMRYLSHIAHRDEAVALQVMDLPFLDRVEWGDSTEVKFLLDLMSSDWEGLQQLLKHPAVLSRVDGSESTPMSLLYLETKGPSAAETIANLPWVKDGLHEFEENGVSLLQQLALKSPTVFQAILSRDREWMPPQTGMDNSTILRLINLATINEYAALQVIEMPFMETIDIPDGDAFRRLVELAEADPSGLDYVLSHPRFSEGITDEQAVEVSLVYLEWSDPEAAQLIRDLAWVADGIAYRAPSNISSIHDDMSKFESGAVRALIDMSRRGREVFLALVGKPWLQGELTRNSYEVFSGLLDLGARLPTTAIKVINMPFLDEVDRKDDGTLETLNELYWEDPGKVAQLVDRLEAGGGLTDDNHFLINSLHLEFANPQAWEMMNGLPWIEDSLDPSEQPGARALIYSALETKWVFPELISKHWVKDGLTDSETDAVWELSTMGSKSYARNAETEAVSLLDMPFLESVNKADAAAVETLNHLLWEGEGDAGYLLEVLSHTTLEGGITDENAVLLALLRPIATYHTESMPEKLDSGSKWVVHRTVDLPHSGTVHLAVFEEAEGRENTLDLLETTVRTQEEFMMEPYPASFSGIVATETGSGGGPSGIITLHPADTGNLTRIATLVAYTYWPFYPTWVRGGAVRLLSEITVLTASNTGAPPRFLQCDLAQNLGELERLQNESAGRDHSKVDGSRCHYDLSLGLYSDLYSNLGDEAFREGFRRLYLEAQLEGHDQICYNPERGRCLVREGFVTGASAANAAIAEEIIDHWYYGDPLGKAKQ